MRNLTTTACAAMTLLSLAGCGPSVRDLVARHQWTEAVQRSNSLAEIQTVQAALRPRVTGRLLVRAYTPAEAAALLGWLPGQIRDGTVSLVAWHAELASPDASIAAVALEPAPTADTVACCENQLAWETLDYRAPRPSYADDAPAWMTTARQLLSLIATPIQTAVGTVRDGVTLATGGAVGNAPVSGPGVDLSVGALLAHLGLRTGEAPPDPSAASRAAAEAQSRARLHALLATDCAAPSPSCVRYALWKPEAPITQVLVSFRYVFASGGQPLSDQIRFAVPPPGGDLASRLQTVFPNGERAIPSLTQVHLNDAGAWVEGPQPPPP